MTRTLHNADRYTSHYYYQYILLFFFVKLLFVYLLLVRIEFTREFLDIWWFVFCLRLETVRSLKVDCKKTKAYNDK